MTAHTATLGPHAGDGICPTVSQHNDTVADSYGRWTKLVLDATKSRGDLCVADNLLELLQRIPELSAHPSKPFSILDQPHPQLRYALDWMTTTNVDCERPIKRTYHYQTMGALQLLRWEYSDASENGFEFLGYQAKRMKSFSHLVLAWAYILSSRWVEILKAGGEKASMSQSASINREDFWEVVMHSHWRATVTRGDKTFYAPWCMERGYATVK